jgi:hypothetical protein
MLIMCHLFVGLILGLMLSVRLGDRRLALFTAFGALLPDIIDKSLGHLLLAGTVDSGRIYAHGIVVLLSVLLIGIIYLQQSRMWSGIALALGILSHQMLDTMWDAPVNWWYPFLGPYASDYYPDYFEHAFWMEIGSVSEWVFFASSMLVVSLLYCDVLAQRYGPGAVRTLRTLLYISAPVTGIMGLIALYAWLFSTQAFLMYYSSPETDILLAVVGIGGAAAMVRFGHDWLHTFSAVMQEEAELM